jgi:hypothetical protein
MRAPASVPSRGWLSAAVALMAACGGGATSSGKGGSTAIGGGGGAGASGGAGPGGAGAGGAGAMGGSVGPGAAGRGGTGVGGGSGTGGAGGLGGAGGPSAPDLTQCNTPTPCPTVTDAYGEIRDPPTDASLRCVMKALHDRTPGIYVHTSTTAGLTSTSTTTWVYLIKQDGTVDMELDGGSVFSRPQICSPQPPTAYDACLASVSTDGVATNECLNVFEWVMGCVAGDVACG